MPEARPNLFTDRDEGCHVVSVEDFIRNVRGSTGFTFDMTGRIHTVFPDAIRVTVD